MAVFGDLLGDGCSAELDQCTLSANRMSGLLVRDGATPAVALEVAHSAIQFCECRLGTLMHSKLCLPGCLREGTRL